MSHIVGTPPDITALLELSDERDTWLRWGLGMWRNGFYEGRAEGIAEGRALEVAEQDEAHRAMAARILRHEPFTELERRRWGPGGREHFGDPRPGDFPGGKGKAA
jgi:hypothetical protein